MQIVSYHPGVHHTELVKGAAGDTGADTELPWEFDDSESIHQEYKTKMLTFTQSGFRVTLRFGPLRTRPPFFMAGSCGRSGTWTS